MNKFKLVITISLIAFILIILVLLCYFSEIKKKNISQVNVIQTSDEMLDDYFSLLKKTLEIKPLNEKRFTNKYEYSLRLFINPCYKAQRVYEFNLNGENNNITFRSTVTKSDLWEIYTKNLKKSKKEILKEMKKCGIEKNEKTFESQEIFQKLLAIENKIKKYEPSSEKNKKFFDETRIYIESYNRIVNYYFFYDIGFEERTGNAKEFIDNILELPKEISKLP